MAISPSLFLSELTFKGQGGCYGHDIIISIFRKTVHKALGRNSNAAMYVLYTLNLYIRITDELLLSAVKSGTAMAGVAVAVQSPIGLRSELISSKTFTVRACSDFPHFLFK